MGLVAGVAVVVVLLLSHGFGRAVPTNNYRPPLPPDALATGCFPLPDGALLDVPHQIRQDGNVATATGPRRRLVGQFDLIGRDAALDKMVEAFTRVGFVAGTPEDDGDLRAVRLTKGSETVTVSAAPYPHTGPGSLVRGQFVMDLPVITAAKDDPVCSDPKSTKRWNGDQVMPQ
ncbi:hypothetical protein GCM10022237_14670 [Nocardioides ginsengisoli]|uniref:Uncharacterized protein n=1 Tax=Nocardioides ginsengisoli TaxID=363868 RepID=A0ABW3W0R2_9ACTN